MQLVHQGMSDEEAVENAIKTLEFGKKKVAVRLTDVCVLGKRIIIFLNHLNMAADQVILGQ